MSSTVDVNVLLCASDEDSPFHHKTLELLDGLAKGLRNVEQLVRLPHARAVGEAEDFWAVYLATTTGVVVRGNLVPDAHLVALMRQNGVGTLWTHDRDFRKFDHVRVRDPFA